MIVMLKSVEDVNKFVAIAGKYDFDIDLISGRYSVNGKSIMAVFSLDLTKPIKVEPQVENSSKLFKELTPFMVNIEGF